MTEGYNKPLDEMEVPEFAQQKEPELVHFENKSELAGCESDNLEENLSKSPKNTEEILYFQEETVKLNDCQPTEINTEQNLQEEKLKGGLLMSEEQKESVQIQETGCHHGLPCVTPQNCCECCNIYNNATLQQRFGITRTDNVFCDCHDICIQEVRYICPIPVDCTFPIPGLSDGLRPGCRGERVIINPDAGCELIITCADEQLQSGCTGVNLRVGFQLIFGNIPLNRFLVMDRVLQFSCTRFFEFPSGAEVTGAALRTALREIDGSQVVADLKCQVLPPDATHPNPRIRVFGTIVEKLWKEENLWISAIRPYRGITVKREFPEPQFIGDCSNESPQCPFAIPTGG